MSAPATFSLVSVHQNACDPNETREFDFGVCAACAAHALSNDHNEPVVRIVRRKEVRGVCDFCS
jgi:hypothetical protein